MPVLQKNLFTRAFLVSLLVASQCLAKLVNATIDDAYGDSRTGAEIDYLPVEAWNDGRLDCETCKARPNSSLLYNRTWHDSTFDPAVRNAQAAATAHFSGVAIYVYCAVARTEAAPDFETRSDMTFYIDGQEVGTLVKEPPGGEGFDYDVLVYKNTSIPPGEHEFVIQNGRIGGDRSLILLDRIVYTYDDAMDKSSGKKGGLGAIIGGAVGGLAALALAITGIMMFMSRRRRQKLSEEESAKVEDNLAPSHYSHHAMPVGGMSHAYTSPHSLTPYGDEGPPKYEEAAESSSSTVTRTEIRHEKGPRL
ncbi:hypothetical protein BKA70DRAFT_1559235 [Coprinopsis sp. MPI-PUGE-AT-0042]|nr:hypothetical protein BKA70DRAFT_1559235 [Coprinopsis sp. MPI-PUGE-AT-0042]